MVSRPWWAQREQQHAGPPVLVPGMGMMWDGEPGGL